MKSLKDQLQPVKKQLEVELAAKQKADAKSKAAAARAKTIRPPEPKLTDEELFARAVDGVSRDAPLQKFDARPIDSGEQIGRKESDAELFLRLAGAAASTRKPRT
jgi:hypothetical protein